MCPPRRALRRRLTEVPPTNAAFASLLTELGVTKAQLLADKELLTSILTYHVVAANVPKANIPLGKAITSVQGSIFKVDAVAGALKITDGRNRISTITATDIKAFNGVVHVIDKVILPANKNIVQTAQALPDFSILVEAVVAANLQGTLSGTGPFTVFAPTNAAFAALLGELGVSKDALLANKALLTNASLAIIDQRTRSSNIVATDVLTSNGVIHVVDKVILPKP